MSDVFNSDNSGPAFPVFDPNGVYSLGLTKREWFAGMALAGLASTGTTGTFEDDAEACWYWADAMVEGASK